MYSTYLKNKVGNLFLMLSLVSGITIAAGIAAQAQDRSGRDRQVRTDRDRDGNRNWRRDQNRNDDNRYRNQNDRSRWHDRDNDRYRNDRYRAYRPPVQVIRPRPREVYVPRNGNYGGYGGYGGYGNNGGYGNYGGYGNNGGAYESQGFQEGLYTGSNDARRGQSYNPYRSHFYKDARSGGYRNAFLRGYQQGFQGNGGGYGRSRIYGR